VKKLCLREQLPVAETEDENHLIGSMMGSDSSALM
jgi:hypothetical protein